MTPHMMVQFTELSHRLDIVAVAVFILMVIEWVRLVRWLFPKAKQK